MARRLKDKLNTVEPGYLRQADAAQYLGISKRTLHTWTNEKLIPVSRMSRRCLLYSRVDLDKVIARFREGGAV